MHTEQINKKGKYDEYTHLLKRLEKEKKLVKNK